MSKLSYEVVQDLYLFHLLSPRLKQIVVGRCDVGSLPQVSSLSYAVGKLPERLEQCLAQDCIRSLTYAVTVLHKRFQLGEEPISRCAYCSFHYASAVLHDRFLQGEPAIAENTRWGQDYYLAFIRNQSSEVVQQWKELVRKARSVV